MLLSFVAHASGCKIMVGVHNTIDITVECQMHVGGRVAFFENGRCRYLQNTVDAVWELTTPTTL